MGGAVSRHNALIASAGADSGGPVKTTEDGAYAVFSAVGQALRLLSRPICCIDAAFDAICGLRGRIALHVGSAERRGDDYFGPTLNRTV